jgi:hypothetical protein
MFISGCGENKQPSQLVTANAAVKKYDKTTVLHGTVRNDKGVIENGTVSVTTLNGQLITSMRLENNKTYEVEIPANTELPLLLKFSADSASTETKNFIAVVIHPGITKYEISPLTTAIAEKAMKLGGYTDSNLRQAAESMVHVPDADKTSTGFRGDPTQHYGGWH